MNYVIITSAYNEENFIEKTILSVIKQTILPSEWVIIDDGSTDNTFNIIYNYSKLYSWINPIKKQHGYYNFGEHAVKLFYYGLSHLKTKTYMFIAKLDADLDIERKDYFEFQLNQMIKNKQLGISSGITYFTKGGQKILTKRSYWHTGGATKFYRKECLDDIGGLIPIFGWDGLDEYKAMFKGWKTRTFFEIHVHHLAKSRAKLRKSKKLSSYNKGVSLYQRGYPFEFVILRFIYLIIMLKFNIALYFIKGYIISAIRNEIRFVNKDEISFNRKIQYLRIIDIFTKKQLL